MYARSSSARHQFTSSFVQSLCDLAVCEAMISWEERRRRINFDSIVRLRLDLAWEVHAISSTHMNIVISVPM